MTTRERWIVYPLLFLALGTAIKPKLAPPELRSSNSRSVTLDVNRIQCRELFVLGKDKRPLIRMSPAQTSGEGEIQLTDRRGTALVRLKADAITRAGLVETFRDGHAQTAMMSSQSGGEIVAFDNQEANTVTLGHRDGRFGVFETNLQSGESRSISSLQPESQ